MNDDAAGGQNAPLRKAPLACLSGNISATLNFVAPTIRVGKQNPNFSFHPLSRFSAALIARSIDIAFAQTQSATPLSRKDGRHPRPSRSGKPHPQPSNGRCV